MLRVFEYNSDFSADLENLRNTTIRYLSVRVARKAREVGVPGGDVRSRYRQSRPEVRKHTRKPVPFKHDIHVAPYLPLLAYAFFSAFTPGNGLYVPLSVLSATSFSIASSIETGFPRSCAEVSSLYRTFTWRPRISSSPTTNGC